jgi:hypothetical protein
MKYSILNQIKNRNKSARFKMFFDFLLFFSLILISFNAIGQNANHIFKTIPR